MLIFISSLPGKCIKNTAGEVSVLQSPVGKANYAKYILEHFVSEIFSKNKNRFKKV